MLRGYLESPLLVVLAGVILLIFVYGTGRSTSYFQEGRTIQQKSITLIPRNTSGVHHVKNFIICNCSHWPIPEEMLRSNLTPQSLGLSLTLKDCTKSVDVAQIFETRRQILDVECKSHGQIHADLSFNWTWQPFRDNSNLYLDKRKNYRMCPVPKAGSTSWVEMGKSLREIPIETSTKVQILPVRHPFTRLVSVYNDLFCLGRLFTCCHDDRFYSCLYAWWIPLLISSGRLEINTDFSGAMNDIVRVKGGRFGSMINQGLKNAIYKSYSPKKKNIIEKYKGVVVPFKDFVNHIFWTYEHGVADHHWNPQTTLCDACRIPYTYILHLENSGEENPHMLNKLGFGDTVQFKKANVRSKNATHQYIKYFKDLPISMLIKLFKYYQFDFKLLNYSL